MNNLRYLSWGHFQILLLMQQPYDPFFYVTQSETKTF